MEQHFISSKEKNIYYTEYKVYDTVEKKLKSFFIYSLYKQLIKEGLTFKYEAGTHKIELSDDSKTIKKTLQWRKNNFDLHLLYRDLK